MNPSLKLIRRCLYWRRCFLGQGPFILIFSNAAQTTAQCAYQAGSSVCRGTPHARIDFVVVKPVATGSGNKLFLPPQRPFQVF